MRITFYLSQRSIKQLCAVTAAGSMAFSANAQLLHRYDFSTGANDSIGIANGTLQGTASISGGSLNTDGSGGALSGGVPANGVMLPGSAVAGITGPFTIESWFIGNFNGGYCTTFSFSDNTRNNYVLATPARGNFPFASSISVIGGGGTWTGPGDTQAGEQYQDNGALHDMLVTYNGTTLAYYIDGALDSSGWDAANGVSPTTTDPGLNLSSMTFIGINGGSPWPDNSIKGSTLDFRIYGQSVSSSQAASLYSLGADANTASILTTIPEPSALALVGLGFISFALRRLCR
ncbi:MAG TPA: LamG-like jellyroll fold domain-containing protein [Candidatus Dormibacteraeota bacterium]|nr:LamG-like jellyroll fold domain-containing protein [Candidatus Dormibacteraeota bacterium]